MQQTLYIIRGLSGSGKSTYAKSLQIPYFEADMYFMDGDEYKFNPGRLEAAHQWCQQALHEALQSGVEAVAVANTCITLKDLTSYLAFKDAYPGLRIVVVELKTQYESVHNMSPEAMARQGRRWVKAPVELYDELITIE